MASTCAIKNSLLGEIAVTSTFPNYDLEASVKNVWLVSVLGFVILVTQEAVAGGSPVKDQPWLPGEFRVSLGNLGRPVASLKSKKSFNLVLECLPCCV